MTIEYFESLADRFIEGTASDELAYKHGMELLMAAGEKLKEIDLSKIPEMSKEDGRILLDEIEKSKNIARIAMDIFVKYPVIWSAANGLAAAIFYAELSLIPMVILSNGEVRDKNQIMSTYLVRNPKSGLIKIGRTINLNTRMSALQCGSGVLLDILFVIPKDKEKHLHKKFANYRVHGEWFEDRDGEIDAYIKSEKEKVAI
ncbi:hypothetical protein VCSRO111_0606 [Vibrio cholerae]|uniref:GIY-YIG nuclease family protein n=1 Tax=Vibrio cholerae TaxID=666 RepID=UPI0011DBE19C|nr:GIY-YIG nuclease family protein [Vibrio cholerae]TXY57637.1 GIY-YIG nuclease family protein [Vibrio cholerae]GHX89544.1 hypothetical protein VCSRO111_0606 [Vibrio cholerae]